MGRAKEGLDDCNVSLRVKPNNDATHHNRALANFRLGNFDDALADCEIALKANANRAQALFLRGLIKSRRSDAPSGNTDIEAAIKIRHSVEEDFRKMGVQR